jgi:hypothetical protein
LIARKIKPLDHLEVFRVSLESEVPAVTSIRSVVRLYATELDLIAIALRVSHAIGVKPK